MDPVRLLEQRFATDVARAACPVQSQAKPSSRASSRIETAQFWAIQRADTAPPRPPRVSPCRRPGLSPAGPGWVSAMLLLGPYERQELKFRRQCLSSCKGSFWKQASTDATLRCLLKQKPVCGKLIYESTQVPDPRQRGPVDIPIAAFTPGDYYVSTATYSPQHHGKRRQKRSQVDDGNRRAKLFHIKAL